MNFFSSSAPIDPRKSIFEFKVKGNDGSEVNLSKFQGKSPILIVNVASEWGLTERNYNELNQLYSKYSNNGLEILAFPCNNFLYQEPGTDEEIKLFTQARNVQFPLMAKIDCGNRCSC